MKTNNSEKRKINILDLVVVIVLVLAVIFGVFALAGGNQEKQAVQGNVTFTLEASGYEPDVALRLKEGQAIYDNTSKTKLGELVSFREKPNRILTENHQSETIEFVEIPDKVDLILEVKATIEDAEEIRIGKRFHCRIGGSVLTGTVIGLDYDETLLNKKEETK